ncbi:MAG: hypothetical protein OEM97_01190 [Acidimicrobiia bacterium]|nr:hypothetical protein [Acidimicrobiia bacterium]
MELSTAASRVVTIVTAALAAGVLATPVLISGLKGRWWIGLVGALAFLAGFAFIFGAFGVAEPSAEFQETFAFRLLNAGLSIALLGGVGLLLFGVMLPARPGSWQAQRRGRDAG